MIGAGARARPAAEGAEQAPPVRPEHRAARTGSRSARESPAAERAPFRMQTPVSPAPDAAGRAARPQVSASACLGLGQAPLGRSAPSPCASEAGLISEPKAGGGIRVEFPLVSPSFCCVAVRRSSAGQDRRAYRAEGARPRETVLADTRCGECWRVQGESRSQHAPDEVGNPESGPLSSKRNTSGPPLTWEGRGQNSVPAGPPASAAV